MKPSDIIYLIIFIAIVMILGYCAKKAMSYDYIVQETGPARVASERMERLMKYHGIDFATIDETGAYFYRDGKRCGLR